MKNPPALSTTARSPAFRYRKWHSMTVPFPQGHIIRADHHLRPRCVQRAPRHIGRFSIFPDSCYEGVIEAMIKGPFDGVK